MGKGNIMRTKCFHMLFLPLFFQSLTFHLSYGKIFLEATNLNSISFFSRPLGTTSPPSLSFVPATEILWAVKKSFTWLQQSQESVMVADLERRSEKKLCEEKKTHNLSNFVTLYAKRASSWSRVFQALREQGRANPWKQRYGSTDRKAQPLPLPPPSCLEANRHRCGLVTSSDLQTTFTLLPWAQKQAKKKWKTQSLHFIPYIQTASLERGKTLSWVMPQSSKS